MQKLTDLADTTLAAQDHAQQQSPGDLPTIFRAAMDDSPIPGSQMQLEVAQLAKAPGKVTKYEYVQFRIYRERDKNVRKEFISEWLQWPIEKICGDPEWGPVTTDKLACATFLQGRGVPTIPVLAVVNPAKDVEVPAINNGSELISYLTERGRPVFAKPNHLLGSFGAFRIDGTDGSDVVVNGEPVPVDELVDTLIGGIEYILQDVVVNHETVATWSPTLATIRTINFVKDSVRLDRALFKVPAAGNPADNYWRSGNLLAAIDLESGRITRAVSGFGPYQEEFDTHPDTGAPLVGVEIPMWDEVQRLNEQTAALFPSIHYQTADIAVTPDGPVIVEVNSGGAFTLPQIAFGRGLLTKENRKFFESCGVNFRKLENPGL